MFTLAANDNPKAKVFKKACDMLKAASLSDPDLEKFEVAQQALGTALHTLERVHLLLFCCHARHTALPSLSAILPVMVTRQQLV